MENSKLHGTYEYINDFLFFTLTPDNDRPGNVYKYCSGVNVTRFAPLTAGKHRFAQNPAVKGLQSANLDLRSFIIANGAEPETLRGDAGPGVASPPDMWSTECLLIKNASETFLTGVIPFSLTNLLNMVLTLCAPGFKLPEPLPQPEALQVYLQSLCDATCK